LKQAPNPCIGHVSKNKNGHHKGSIIVQLTWDEASSNLLPVNTLLVVGVRRGRGRLRLWGNHWLPEIHIGNRQNPAPAASESSSQFSAMPANKPITEGSPMESRPFTLWALVGLNGVAHVLVLVIRVVRFLVHAVIVGISTICLRKLSSVRNPAR